MAAHSVEVNDSDSIAASLLSSRVPTTVTRHGDTVGVFYPARRLWTEAEWREFREQGERVQLMLREAGVTEEELLEDFRQLHDAERQQAL